jgi:O-succinylbenzoic acid--CoA ligase
MDKPIILSYLQFSHEKILPLCHQKLAQSSVPDWEKELYSFLIEWFSDSEFIIAQTSGSTGEPKSIELPKSLILKSAERTIGYFSLEKGDRILLSLPCRFIAGKMMVIRAIAGQMNLIAVDPASNFDFLQNETFDFGAMVPNQVVKILEQPSGKEQLQKIRNLLIGGSAISSELEDKISQLSNRVVLTYGMTETASHIALRELSGTGKSDTYQCLQGISVSLNENNCLKIHLPELKVPLQTNDLAELLSDTSFKILGRADSVIISGGIKYSPESIEKKLDGFFNQRFIISSVPDKKLGEKLALVLEGKPTSVEPIKEKLKALLPPFEQPKMILFVDQFPETSSGKIIRSEVKTAIQQVGNL